MMKNLWRSIVGRVRLSAQRLQRWLKHPKRDTMEWLTPFVQQPASSIAVKGALLANSGLDPQELTVDGLRLVRAELIKRMRRDVEQLENTCQVICAKRQVAGNKVVVIKSSGPSHDTIPCGMCEGMMELQEGWSSSRVATYKCRCGWVYQFSCGREVMARGVAWMLDKMQKGGSDDQEKA